MRILLTGATGYVGGFLAAEARRSGHRLLCLSRQAPADCSDWRPFDLNAPPVELPPADVLIHAAFDHLPGRYRGGEGDDPEAFLRRNRDGSLALFETAARAGIRRILFLSTRAVYGGECVEQGISSYKRGTRGYFWRAAGVGHGTVAQAPPGERDGDGNLKKGNGEANWGWTLVRTGTRLWATYVTDCSYKTGIEYLNGEWRKYDYNVPRYEPHE